MCEAVRNNLKGSPRRSLVITSLVVFVSTIAVAQKTPEGKFTHAIERSQDAARILSLLADADSGFPKELIGKARLVAVFPRAAREDMLVRKFLHGYGVISARGENGWTHPAFYQFLSAPRKFAGGSNENLGLILVLMADESLTWLDKDKAEFKRERGAVLGPLTTDIQTEPEAPKKPILAYTYYNGKLNGKIDPDFFNDFILDQDNNINDPIYGVKGREVLGGKKIDPASLPADLAAFQDALQKYWPK